MKFLCKTRIFTCNERVDPIQKLFLYFYLTHLDVFLPFLIQVLHLNDFDDFLSEENNYVNNKDVLFEHQRNLIKKAIENLDAKSTFLWVLVF